MSKPKPERAVFDRALIRFFGQKCAQGPDEFIRWAVDIMFRSRDPQDLPRVFARLYGERTAGDFIQLFRAITREAATL